MLKANTLYKVKEDIFGYISLRHYQRVEVDQDSLVYVLKFSYHEEFDAHCAVYLFKNKVLYNTISNFKRYKWERYFAEVK